MSDPQRTPVPPTDDDTEGQAVRWSDQNVKSDVEQLPTEPDDETSDASSEDDTEGQGARWSDQNLKSDVEQLPPSDHDEEEATADAS